MQQRGGRYRAFVIAYSGTGAVCGLYIVRVVFALEVVRAGTGQAWPAGQQGSKRKICAGRK